MQRAAAPQRFDLDLTTPTPIPEAGIDRAVELMRSGRLFRYGETGDDGGEVALFEREFADLLGRRYAIAVNSCGASLFLALRSAGVAPGDDVLLNALTLAPVPGALEHAGAQPVLVEVTDGCTIDIDDLDRKARNGARVLVLSHMRGHVADMEAITAICERHGLTLIEDCAHSLGARWNGRATGTFGHVGCFSTQSFKHLNSGEGGVLVTDDDETAARAILYSGSYMLYGQHLSRPPEVFFEKLRAAIPNYSMRMTAVAAAVLRPQLPLLPERIKGWNNLYQELEDRLAGIPEVRLIARPPAEAFVGSSLQFSLPTLTGAEIQDVLQTCAEYGLHIKWFGRQEASGFTSRPDHWAYLGADQVLPQTQAVLAKLCDIRIPLVMTVHDSVAIAGILDFALGPTRGRIRQVADSPSGMPVDQAVD